MKIAVMQPYLFPYIGYFQLINAVDKFVFYDDVNFIKQGWINRNKILVSGKDFLFTIPLVNATSFSLIKDTRINEKLYESWKVKFLQTILQSYKKAPYFKNVYNLIDTILSEPYITISEFAIGCVRTISIYLGITTEFITSSESYKNQELDRQERLFDICKSENANSYINALGGQDLYTKEDFSQKEITLNFIKALPVEYKQFKNEFIPSLSIIDVLMFNSIEEIEAMINNYELI